MAKKQTKCQMCNAPLGMSNTSRFCITHWQRGIDDLRKENADLRQVNDNLRKLYSATAEKLQKQLKK